jgi:hypothetical protein
MKNLIIDPNYIPTPDLNYIDYFSRAMNFAQTNYHQQLKTLNNIFFHKLVPTTFFERYCSVICDLDISFNPYHYYFNYHNSINDQILKSLSVIQNIDQKQAVDRTAKIINTGIKLYGWNKYRDNFLDKFSKLQVLSLIDHSKSLQLSREIDLMEGFEREPLLISLATRWSFETVETMLAAINNRFVMQHKIIGQILLYAMKTFETA